MEFALFADFKEIDNAIKNIAACGLVLFGVGTLSLVGFVAFITRRISKADQKTDPK